MEIFEELARADASVAWCVWNGNTHWTAAQLSPEAARTIHADPDVVTANSTRASGQAQVVAGGYRVNGRWSLVSGCELGTWMVLLCVVHEDGKPRLTPAGAPETASCSSPHRMRDHRHLDGWRAARHRQPRCGRARSVRTEQLWVILHRPACPARAALSHPAILPRHPRPRRDGAWRSPEPRSRHSTRLPARRRLSEPPRCSATTMARKFGCRRRKRSCVRPGCFCSTAWSGCGTR